MNFLINSNCPRHCDFCFMTDSYRARKKEMSLDEFKTLYEKGTELLGNAPIGILGGEPTLAKNFLPIMGYLNEKGTIVKLFSNLLGHSITILGLSRMKFKDLYITWNNSGWSKVNEKFKTKALDNLEVLLKGGLEPYKIAQSLTLQVDTDIKDLTYLVEMYKTYGTYSIRFSLNVQAQTTFIRSPNKEKVWDVIKYLIDNGMQLTVDGCGAILPCLFTGDQYHFIVDRMKDFGTYCNGAAMDVLPDGSLIPCLPYSGVQNRINLMDCTSTADMISKLHSNYQMSRDFSQCRTGCEYAKICPGPCQVARNEHRTS